MANAIVTVTQTPTDPELLAKLRQLAPPQSALVPGGVVATAADRLDAAARELQEARRALIGATTIEASLAEKEARGAALLQEIATAERMISEARIELGGITAEVQGLRASRSRPDVAALAQERFDRASAAFAQAERDQAAERDAAPTQQETKHDGT